MKKFAIIELILESEEVYNYSCCNVVINKNGFVIKDSIFNLPSTEVLPEYVFNSTVILSIHGRGVITKDSSQLSGLEDIIKDNQTFLQKYEIENIQVVSLIRQELLNHYLVLLFEKKICIKKIFLGAIPLLQLTDIIDRNEIIIYNYKFSTENNKQIKISSVKSLETTFEYQKILYSSDQSMLIAITLMLIENNRINTEDQFDNLMNLSSRYYYSRYFKLAQKLALFLFFFLLVLNFSFFMILSKDNTTGVVNLNHLNSLKNKTDSLRTIIKNQEKKTREAFVSNANLSLLIDRITSSIPAGIKLTEININPSKFSRERNLYLFESDKILLYGTSDNSYILNQWVKQLEQTSIISKSNFITYKQESGLANGSFILELFFNNRWLEFIN